MTALPRGHRTDSFACGNQTYLSLIRGTPGNTCDFTKVSLENNGWGCRVRHLPDISIIITGSTKKVHVIGAKSWFYVERGVQVTREGAKWFLPQWCTIVHVDLVISASSKQTWVGGVQNEWWKTCNEEQWSATILARNLRTLFSPVPFCNDLKVKVTDKQVEYRHVMSTLPNLDKTGTSVWPVV